MEKYSFNIQKFASFLIIIMLFGYLLIIGKNILVPLVFAGLFAFMLKPLCQKIENYIPNKSLAIPLAFVIALTPIVGVVYLFSVQFIDVFQNMDSISAEIQEGIQSIFFKINSKFGFSKGEAEQMVSENSSEIMKGPLSYLGATISVSSNFLINSFLTFIYTFLLLLYRTSLKKFYIIQFGDKIKEGAENVLERIQTIVQKYLFGLLTVILILGVFNSIGLYLIGIKYAFFWGFLAAVLAVIPYVGTFLGGFLPFLFALATTGTFWQPAAVIGLFFFVQIVEGNIITPMIVGNSVKINPLAAILALLIGSSIWGLGGLVLSLPIIAIVRVVLIQVDFLKPVGLLLSDELYDKESVFEEKFNKEKFRLSSFFKKKKV